MKMKSSRTAYTLKTDAIISFRAWITFYQPTRRRIVEDLKLILETQISRDERCWYNHSRDYQQVLFILYTKHKLKRKRRQSYCKKDLHSAGQRNP